MDAPCSAPASCLQWVLSSPGPFGVPRSAKYAGLPPLDHPARGHSPDEIRRLAVRAASPRRRSSSGNSLCGQNSVGSWESARPFKGIICDDISEFESFSIGAGWCQALSDCSVDPGFDATRRVLASLRDRHLGPPMMGSGGCGGPIYRDVLAVRLTTGIRTRNGLASSIVPAGDIAPPVGGIHIFSCRISIVHNSLLDT